MFKNPFPAKENLCPAIGSDAASTVQGAPPAGATFTPGVVHDEPAAYAAASTNSSATRTVGTAAAVEFVAGGGSHGSVKGAFGSVALRKKASMAHDQRLPVDQLFAPTPTRAFVSCAKTVVALCDAICPRVLAAASVEDAHLEQVVGLSVAERDRLNALLPRVPGFLMSFDDAAVSPQSLDEPSLVTQPPTTLDHPHHPVNLQVSVLKQGHAERYRAIEWAPSGLRMTGGTPQAERRLVVLEFDKGLKINAIVTLCTAAGRGWVIELKPFAMDRAAKASWAKLGEPPAPPAG